MEDMVDTTAMTRGRLRLRPSPTTAMAMEDMVESTVDSAMEDMVDTTAMARGRLRLRLIPTMVMDMVDTVDMDMVDMVDTVDITDGASRMLTSSPWTLDADDILP